MGERLSGALTFVLTDIEGSTALWEANPDAMRAASARHDRIVERCVEEHGGHLVRPRGEGDSRFAVFPLATDAIAAVAALQGALHSEPWPPEAPIRVRIALHTGEADLRDGDYYGTAVNRCARLRSLGCGGQSLLSSPTYELVRDALPADVALRDLGSHRLKDLLRPERIYQLFLAGLPNAFPPLKSLDAIPNNLPAQATSLIGREEEIRRITALLERDETRLVTVSGPGGIGKTRLGLQVAADLLDRFRDGAFFVALAPIADPSLVIPTIAQTLGIREAGGQPLSETLRRYLHDRQMLLLIDNFEQVMPAATQVAELLSATPELKLLVTSREALRVSGEHLYAVSPLSLPDPRRLPSLERLTQYESVRLFIDRAKMASADFAMTDENAPAVAEICHQLDGLPLAIELAAARVRLLPPQSLLPRLANRLKLLTGGARDLPARQQTIRATIDWSYNLLEETEKTFFARLSVFRGGWTLEATEAVCNAEGNLGIEVLDGLDSLLNKSLIRVDDSSGEDARFSMLETLREYAGDRLRESAHENDRGAVARRHANHFADHAEAAAVYPTVLVTPERIERLEAEHDNIRAALASCAADPDGWERGVRLVCAMQEFWSLRGYAAEGRRWPAAFLSHPGLQYGTEAHLSLLITAYWCVSLDRDGELRGRYADEALGIARRLGDRKGVGHVLFSLSFHQMSRKEFALARAMLEECLEIFGEAEDDDGMTAPVLSGLAMIALQNRDYAEARRRAFEGEEIDESRGVHGGTCALILTNAAVEMGDLEEALRWAREYLDVAVACGRRLNIAESLEVYASIRRKQERASAAARLLGAAEALRKVVDAEPRTDDAHSEMLEALRAALTPEVFQSAWAEGAAMPIELAIANAMEDDEAD